MVFRYLYSCNRKLKQRLKDCNRDSAYCKLSCVTTYFSLTILAARQRGLCREHISSSTGSFENPALFSLLFPAFFCRSFIFYHVTPASCHAYTRGLLFEVDTFHAVTPFDNEFDWILAARVSTHERDKRVQVNSFMLVCLSYHHDHFTWIFVKYQFQMRL